MLSIAMQKQLKVLTIADIRDIKPAPCGDPVHDYGASEDWTGTIIDILKATHIPAMDRIWVACYSKQVSDKTLRLFAVWNARRELAACEKTYPEAIACIDAAERYANGEGTLEELLEAQKKNRAADLAADRAAYLAAYLAADRAAYLAAYRAADLAAYLAADRAAYLAAYRAADLAAYRAADRAAYRAAYLAAYLAADRAADLAQQVEHLISMIEQEYAIEKPVKRTYEGWLKKTVTNPRSTKKTTYSINGHHEMVVKAAHAAGLAVEELEHCYKITGAKSAQALNKLLKGTRFISSSHAYGPCDFNIYVMTAVKS